MLYNIGSVEAHPDLDGEVSGSSPCHTKDFVSSLWHIIDAHSAHSNLDLSYLNTGVWFWDMIWKTREKGYIICVKCFLDIKLHIMQNKVNVPNFFYVWPEFRNNFRVKMLLRSTLKVSKLKLVIRHCTICIPKSFNTIILL